MSNTNKWDMGRLEIVLMDLNSLMKLDQTLSFTIKKILNFTNHFSSVHSQISLKYPKTKSQILKLLQTTLMQFYVYLLIEILLQTLHQLNGI